MVANRIPEFIIIPLCKNIFRLNLRECYLYLNRVMRRKRASLKKLYPPPVWKLAKKMPRLRGSLSMDKESLGLVLPTPCVDRKITEFHERLDLRKNFSDSFQ
jgi:hypothetical protein